MTETQVGSPKPPLPRFAAVSIWTVHRAIHRLTGGRGGLWRPKGDRWGTLRLSTIGRRSGKRRAAILGYFEDGPNLVTLAMNGWLPGDPAWWHNLQAHPDTTVELSGRKLATVRARKAHGDEHDRLWARWRQMKPDIDIDGFAPQRPGGVPIVVLEPRGAESAQAVGPDWP